MVSKSGVSCLENAKVGDIVRIHKVQGRDFVFVLFCFFHTFINAIFKFSSHPLKIMTVKDDKMFQN